MFNAASKTDNVSAEANYIESVFSTYLYTGTGASQTINNGLDLSTNGGLVWIKERSSTSASPSNKLFDTNRGATKYLKSDSTAPQTTDANSLTAFNSNGFTVGSSIASNTNNSTYVAWSFRKQPKFFDVVTYSGDDVSNRAIPHSLGSVPGCIIIKTVSGGDQGWIVYHRSLANPTNSALRLEDTAPVTALPYFPTNPTSTNFYVAGGGYSVNSSGYTYVAYIFAHDAGGFGPTGTDNVISCGYGTAASNTSAINVTLGYEPQFILMKNATDPSGSPWWMFDTMRGIGSYGLAQKLEANSGTYESTVGNVSYPVNITSTGFSLNVAYLGGWGSSSDRFIYIAIRRGPMKTPTTGASVFEPAFSTNGVPEYKSNTVISGFDTAINIYRPGYSDQYISYPYVAARLTGTGQILQTSRVNAEYNYSTAATFAYNTGWFGSAFGADTNRESYMFKRAPGFHDVVCYPGTGSPQNINHNLTAVPEMIIAKIRNFGTYAWRVYHSSLGSGQALYLNLTNSVAVSTGFWNDTNPTASVFTVGSDAGTNASGYNMVAYLFASCPGVSKVGSYSGTGANQTINCGFPSGVRFVLIKRTDTTGDWYVYDTTRGMTSGNDPYILLNSTAAEVTGTNYVETIATGFRLIGSNAGTNASGGSYIFLAVA